MIGNREEVIQNTIQFVKKELTSAEGGHDWFHVERVYRNALHIATREKEANRFLVALGALLHDIADYKFHDGNERLGPEKARRFLVTQGLPQKDITAIVKLIENISFKGGNFKSSYHSRELEIVQDADRLDAIGAIGIARTFNYGGFKNQKIYDPNEPPKLAMNPEEYKKSKAPTINHFYEKLLLLKDQMHTPTGRKMAAQRHHFMETFLEQFFTEWEGEN